MLKNAIIQQKLEKERFLSRTYIPREKLGAFKQALSSDMIKVITGPRRAGKSVFAFLLLKGEDFAYVNFDDEALLKPDNYDAIFAALLEVYPESKYFLFDEIQNLDKWEVFVSKLHRRGYNLVLTGSNARLLSSELATALTGRYAAVEILPFSFKEFLLARGYQPARTQSSPEAKAEVLGFLEEYLRQGGYPEVTVKNLEAKPYLETLFDALLLKDVVKRFRVRYTRQLYDLAQYLMAHFASEFSYTKLRNALGLRSTATVEKYARYLEEAYLLYVLNRFSHKFKEQLKAPKKAYFVDTGFLAAKAFQVSRNSGRLMENAVFIELVRRGYVPNESLFYYKTRNKKEVDFILREGTKVQGLIQVCLDLDSEGARKREHGALIEAGEELDCRRLTILSRDTEAREPVKGGEIKIVPLWKWLTQGAP